MEEVILPEAADAALEAIEHGRTDIVKTLIDKVKSQRDLSSFLDQYLSNGKTLLEIAVENNQVDISRTLLREGADPSLRDKSSGKSIIERAVSERMKDAFDVEFLQAVAQSDPDLKIIKRFLSGGLCYASTLDDPKTRNNALHWAASFGCKEIVEFLAQSNTECIDNDNYEGITPLHEAALRGNADIIALLLKAGSDPKICVKEGKYAGKNAADLLRDDLKELIPNGMNGHGEDVVESLGSSSEQIAAEVVPLPEVYPLPSPLITDERLKLLWPPPQSILEVQGEPLFLSQRVSLSISPGCYSVHEILDIVDHVKEIMYEQSGRCLVLSNEDHPLSSSPPCLVPNSLQIVVNERLFHVKGAYKFIVSDKGMKLLSGDKGGIMYGLTTFIQLMRLCRIPGPEGDECLLRPLIINDFPHTSIRGILLDLNAYGRIPYFKILLSMIDIWSFMKVNHLHMFIRLSRSKKWQLPYSKINLLSIDRYCRQRAIHFVPALDISTDVNSIEDAREIVHVFNEVISCFDSSEFLHLGPRLSSLISMSSEYFDTFIPPIKRKNMTLMLCSNSIHPTCNYIPSDALLLYYSFEKCVSGFRSNVEHHYNRGYNFAFCSGTNAWSSVAGSPDKMKENLFDVQKICHSLHGMGSINAHWASDPSFNHLVFAWPGYILSSGLGWNTNLTNDDNISSLLEDVLGHYIVKNKNEAKALIELGRIEESFKSEDIVSKILKILTNAQSDNAFLNPHTPEDFGEAIQGIRRVQMKLLDLKSPNRTLRGMFQSDDEDNPQKEIEFDGSSLKIRWFWSREVYLSSELLLIGARVGRGLLAAKDDSDGVMSYQNLPPTFKTDIANRLLSLIDLYKNVWTSSHVLSGLEGSLLVLTKFFKKLVPE